MCSPTGTTRSPRCCSIANSARPSGPKQPLRSLVNDRWQGEFVVDEIGRYEFTLEAWVDHFKTWRAIWSSASTPDSRLAVDLLIGAEFVEQAAARRSAGRRSSGPANVWALKLREIVGERDSRTRRARPFPTNWRVLMERYPRSQPRHSLRAHSANRCRSAQGALRSLVRVVSALHCRAARRARHVRRLRSAPAATSRAMGFDMLYLPPIHPIGNNLPQGQEQLARSRPGRSRQPLGDRLERRRPQIDSSRNWARLTISAAWSSAPRSTASRSRSTSPISARPIIPTSKNIPSGSGTGPTERIQYAENPPKKYQDIYPIDFETENWRELWDELKSVMLYWIEQGVRYLSRRQSPHENVSLLGRGDSATSSATTRMFCFSPKRSRGRKCAIGSPSSASASPTPISPGAIRSRS